MHSQHSPDGQQEMSRKNLVGDLARSSTREIIAYIYLRGKYHLVNIKIILNFEYLCKYDIKQNCGTATETVETLHTRTPNYSTYSLKQWG